MTGLGVNNFKDNECLENISIYILDAPVLWFILFECVILETGFETPSFLCDGFTALVAMKDIVDYEKQQRGSDGSVAGDWRRKSLRAIKFAMEHMEAKPTTTKVGRVLCQNCLVDFFFPQNTCTVTLSGLYVMLSAESFLCDTGQSF